MTHKHPNPTEEETDMCKVGGGANRCLAHNPASKYVVKVVTTKTKVDEPTVKNTLLNLSKEGKNLPSPSPETVKSWVDTEKFATQYDPAISEHDRKIQINRLENTEVENVSGGHFHAWKNLQKAVRSQMAQKVAATSLMVGMSVSMVGCFANGDGDDKNPVVPDGSPTSTSAPVTPSPEAAYGDVTGSGEKVETDRGTYETITLDPSADIYQYNNGAGHTPELEAAGWTAEDGAAGQKLVADYMVREFVDSPALETGDEGFQEWYKTRAAEYYSPTVYEQLGQMGGSSNAIIGNFGGVKAMPNLIHDGSPREKSLSLKLDSVAPYAGSTDARGINYSIQYSAEYRVDDANAAAFAGGTMGQTGEQFLDGMMAKPQLRDGTGENVYRAYGTAYVVVGKDANNQLKIIGFSSTTDYDASDFTQPMPK